MESSMRIAVLVDHFPAFSETFILRQITGLIERGHQVDIFANRRGEMAAAHPEITEYKLLDRAFFPDVPANKLRRVLRLFSVVRPAVATRREAGD